MLCLLCQDHVDDVIDQHSHSVPGLHHVVFLSQAVSRGVVHSSVAYIARLLIYPLSLEVNDNDQLYLSHWAIGT